MTCQGESINRCDCASVVDRSSLAVKTGGTLQLGTSTCSKSSVCSRSHADSKSQVSAFSQGSATWSACLRSPAYPKIQVSQHPRALPRSLVSKKSPLSHRSSVPRLFHDCQSPRDSINNPVSQKPHISAQTRSSFCSKLTSNSKSSVCVLPQNYPVLPVSSSLHSIVPRYSTYQNPPSYPMSCQGSLICRAFASGTGFPACERTTAGLMSSILSRSTADLKFIACLGSPFYQRLLIYLILLIVSAVAIAGEREPVLQCYIVEELPPGTPTGCAIVSDYGLDRKYNSSALAQLRFSFLVHPPPDRHLFSIDEEGGTIRTTRKIDREELCPRMEECCVKFDVAVRPIQFLLIIKVRVEILDINDNSPSFDQTGGVSFDLSESSDPGTSFPLPSADDLDQPRNGVHHYEIVPPSDVFELSLRPRPDGSSNIRLVLKTKVDRETRDFYQFRLVAFDGGETSRTAVLPVNVTILDTNDNAPEFDNSTYEVRLREDVTPGVAIVRVRAVDKDLGSNGVVTYNFTTDTLRSYGRVFGIDPDLGTIHTKSGLDYETQPVYVIYATACDRAEGVQLTSRALVVVRLDDINDNEPSIRVNALAQSKDQQRRHQPEVVEGSDVGAFVAHVTVDDKDSGANGKI